MTNEAINSAHARDAQAVVAELRTDAERGLASAKVEDRRARYGANAIASIRSRSPLRILVDQFMSLVIALLAMAAFVAWMTGDRIDAAAIAVVLVINALVGFATEWQASRAMNALRREATTTARVRREGRESIIDARDLVPGDIVVLNAGDRVPADLRLIEAASLRTQESALTGESTLVEKSATAVSAKAIVGERTSMAYLATTVAAGRAVGVVVATGARTELGRIGRLVAAARDEATPLERRLSELGRRLVYVVLCIAAIVFATGWAHGEPLGVMFEVAISLAVAAVPEGLPAVTTLILALGVMRMARERAIVRKLVAVETLGSTTVICSDKTGTLTENRMTVRELRLSNGQRIEVDHGKEGAIDSLLLGRAIRAGILCNEASFTVGSDRQATSTGDPTETALLHVAHNLGIDVAGERSRLSKVAELPFDSATSRMTTVHDHDELTHLVTLKGAPTVVLAACTRFVDRANSERELTDDWRAQLLEANEAMAGCALRVLALAEKHVEKPRSGCVDDASLEHGFTFLGFVGMIDPPRAEVAESIRRARTAGIRTVMLTGDQLSTARAIARELHLSADGAEPVAIHARDLEGADHGRIAAIAREVDVFARVSPEDKLHIVEALQGVGEVVAVTGDGVNDAPALRQADIGVAMGLRGTEVAKEASDIVLADDNFATIVRAVEGGRTIYANIIKFVHMMFTHNLGEVIMIFGAIVLGWPLPLLPLQILWMNLVTDVFPALALAVEPAAPGVMQSPPRSPRSPLFSKRFIILIGWQGAMLALISLTAYAWAVDRYGAGSHARTVALFSLIATQIGHLFNCRSRMRSAFEGLLSNPWVWVAAAIVVLLQIAAVAFGPLARVLQITTPTTADLVVLAASVLIPIAIVEVTKIFARRAARVSSSNFKVPGSTFNVQR